MAIGVESSHGFGDQLFNNPLIKAIHEHYNDKVIVASSRHCIDALANTPWIHKIIPIDGLHHGMRCLQELGCNPVFQITQNLKFFEFLETDPNHSLIYTPTRVGKSLNLPDFDPRPIFNYTNDELQTGSSYRSDKPIIAIEAVFTSGQSWANRDAFNLIINKYKNTHRILWLSNAQAPSEPYVDNMLRFSRRQCIMHLQHCERFFSVGSGFFCASLALPTSLQPREIVCLWIDSMYRYERPLGELKWHPNIRWVHTNSELIEVL